ncbi:MAG: transglycosylase domain-containing protein [Cytophagales bacterium]|nr:transglycosylase domain-containing protein [Bernardetiaceae bacterium]MDW8210889.1 transglycosylase domain-containing protein [Cytophagales bacterium]
MYQFLCQCVNFLRKHNFFSRWPFKGSENEGVFEKWSRRCWKGLIGGFILIWLYFKAVEYNFLYLFGELPNTEQLENPKIPTASEIYTEDGVLLGRYFRENRTPVRYQEISPYLINALIAIEDIRFYDHSGIDLKALVSVVANTLSSLGRSSRGGGSTITQQLAKNLFKTRRDDTHGLLGYIPLLRTVIIKTKEWIVAVNLEKAYSKEEILTMYFNTVDFGSNAYGIKTAAKTFFATTPAEVNLQQAATLVGLLKAPTYYSPVFHPQNAIRRRNLVLAQMEKYGFIDSATLVHTQKLPLEVHFTVEKAEDGTGTYFRGVMNNYLKSWCENNGYDLYADGLKIYTTIDSRMQRYAEEAVAERMKDLQAKFEEHWRGMNPWRDENQREIPNYIENAIRATPIYKELFTRFKGNPAKIDSALKAPRRMTVFSWDGERDTLFSLMDSMAYYRRFLHAGLMAMDPYSGYIRAWVGGINYKYFKFDHVKQSRRQPGSAFKPIVYATAIDSFGYSPCSKMVDGPVTIQYIEKGQKKYWSPHNADWTYSYDTVSLRYAIGRSLNTIVAKIIKEIGWHAVINYARKMGITSPLDTVPSVGLGSCEVSLYELVGAYATFLNGGVWTEPMFITRIEDKNGRIIQRFSPYRRRAMSPETAFLMVYMLRGGLQEPGGTSARLYSFRQLWGNNEIGGKTGTSSNYADGWYIGITKDLVVGTWIGGQDRSIHFRTSDTGEASRTALPLFGIFMEKVYADTTLGVTKGRFPTEKELKIRVTKPYFCPTPIKPKPDSLRILDSLRQIELLFNNTPG